MPREPALVGHPITRPDYIDRCETIVKGGMISSATPSHLR
jgi:hypothetical protein